MTSVTPSQTVLLSANASVVSLGSVASSPRTVTSPNSLPKIRGVNSKNGLTSDQELAMQQQQQQQQLQAAGDHTCDYLPEELLLVLAQPPPPLDNLGPPTRYRNLHVSNVVPRKPAANVWHYSKQREKLKHLMKNTPCICGAGKDISFLYDVPKVDVSAKPKDVLPNDVSAVRSEDHAFGQMKKNFQLPDSLIPEEYHIVRNKGVMGLECEEDQYTILPKDHEHHLVLFPSMNPSSRFEVIQLKKTLHAMLAKAGITDDDEELKGPSQMHQLIELIKQEQNIYNIIFHELIRQVSIECVERGELLSEVRKRYSDILSRVPKQIKSLHEEVLAQRAIDRRLTEELFRFKSTITLLTSELTAVKQHDREVSRQALKAQEELRTALAEAHRNSNLLTEYQELYELQRKRLEKEIKSLSEETELWCNACYTLANKVMEEYSLNSAKKLCIVEKCWHQLASHFTVVLGEKDTSELTTLQALTDAWRQQIDQFYLDLKDLEEEMRKQIEMVVSDIQKWRGIFTETFRSKNGQPTLTADKEKLLQLVTNMKYWQQVLSCVNDKFGGDTLLNNQEILIDSQTKVSHWTNFALRLFNRHQPSEGSTHQCQSLMIDTNQQVDLLLKRFQNRITGENGVAVRLLHVANNIEAWDLRLSTSLLDSVSLTSHQWTNFFDLLDDWSVTLTEAVKNIGSSVLDSSQRKNENDSNIAEISEVLRSVNRWMTSTAHSIDSEDAKLSDEVYILHKSMTHWMTQALMDLAPDRKQLSAEAKEAELFYRMTKSELQDKAKTIAVQLSDFTKYVVTCCNLFVSEEMQRRLEAQEENATYEHNELQRLNAECEDWKSMSQLVLYELAEAQQSQAGQSAGQSTSQTEAQEITDFSEETSSPEPGNLEEAKEETLEEDGERMATEEDEEWEEEEEEGKAVQPDQPSADTENPKGEAPLQLKIASPRVDEDQPREKPSSPPAVDAAAAAAGESDGVKGQGLEAMKEEPASNVATDEIEVIGYDSSTRTLQLTADAPEIPSGCSGKTVVESGYDALMSIQFLQQQLLTTEGRAQEAELRASRAEAELEQALTKIRSLERSIQSISSPIPSATNAVLISDRTAESRTPEKRHLGGGGTGKGSSAGFVPKEKSVHRGSSKTKTKKK